MKMMDAIGIGARLRPHGCPIARISVTEGLSHSPLLFDSTEGGAGDPLGHMVENRLLRLALPDAVAGAGNVTLNAPARAVRLDRGPARVEGDLDSGRLRRAPLVVVTEGRHSPPREAGGIKVTPWTRPEERP